MGGKRILRSKASTVLLFLLLTSSFALLYLGVNVYQSTAQQVKQIEQSHTVLAVPQEQLPVYYQQDQKEFLLLAENFADRAYMARDEYLSAFYDKSLVRSVNIGKAFGAVSTLKPLISSTIKTNTAATIDNDGSLLFSVFEAKCLEATTQRNYMGPSVYENEEVSCEAWEAMAVFQVEKVLSMNPALTAPKKFTMFFYNLPDGTPPVQVGEQVVLWGQYSEAPFYMTTETMKNGKSRLVKKTFSGMVDMLIATDPGAVTQTVKQADGAYLLVNTENPARPFIYKADDARLDDLIAYAETQQAAVSVFGVNDLKSLLYFHENVAMLTAGRSFTKDEVERGAPVCVISQELAEQNGLALGDSIFLSLYGAQYSNLPTSCSLVSLLLDDLKTEVTAQIVGLYSAPLWDNTEYAFSPNTIFLPDTALPNEGTGTVDWLTGNGNSYTLPNCLFTLTIEPAQQQAFLEAMAQRKLENSFQIYDGGFSDTFDSLAAVKKDGQTILIACAAGALLLSIAALALHFLRMKGEVRILRLLGTPVSKGWRYGMGATLPVVLVSSVVGGGVGLLLSNRLLETLRNTRMGEVGDFSSQALPTGLLSAPDLVTSLTLFVLCLCVMAAIAAALSPMVLPGAKLAQKEKSE